MEIVKFILGWIMWFVLFVLSLLFSLLTWNWNDSSDLNMKTAIIELFGRSTWEAMTGDYEEH